MNRDLLELQVRELFHQQLFGVLATNTGTVNAGPYVSLIAFAVTVIGRAVEQHGREKAFLQELFLARHPELERFALEASSALFKILVNYTSW